MLKTWWPLLVFLVWAAFARYIYVCLLKDNACCEQTAVSNSQKLSLVYGDQILLSGYAPFAFAQGSNQCKLSANNDDFLDKVAEYMKKDSSLHLTVTGHFTATEAGVPAGMYENLGLSRAALVADYLSERGIARNRIQTDSRISDNGSDLVFGLRNPAGDDKLQSVAEQNSFSNMSFRDLNFKYNSTEFEAGQQFESYIDSLVAFSTANPNKTIVVTGHTDVRGEEAYNQKLGLARAQAVCTHLKKIGVKGQLKAASEGETAPVDKTDTEEAHLRNRRVNIQITD